MVTYKYFNYPKIGNVLFQKSSKAKRIIISVKSQSNIRVAVPRFISFRKAELLVLKKLDWISKQQRKCLKKINVFELSKSASPKEKLGIKKQVKHFATRYGFTVRKVTLRNMKTRWGSCTAQNNISLNNGIIALTDELRDYIILHELLHTKIKNHSKEFWDELSNFIPEPKKLNKRLNQNYEL